MGKGLFPMTQKVIRISLKNERQKEFFSATQTLPENLQPYEDWIKRNEVLQLTFPSGHSVREAMKAFKAQFPKKRHNVNSSTSVIMGPLGGMPLTGDRSPWGGL